MKRRASRSRSRDSSRTWPPARSTARCRASTSSRPRSRASTAPATTCRTCEVIYWSMRVMAFAGVLMFLVAAVGALAVLEAEARAGALVPLDGDRRDRVPVHRRDRRLDPHRDGTPAVDRAGPAADERGELAERQHDVARHQPRRSSSASTSSSASSTSCSCAATRGPTGRGARGAAGYRRSTLLMDLQILWFVPDRGLLGGLLRARGLRLRRRHAAAVRAAERARARRDVPARSARSGTATRSGSSSPPARRSPRSRPGTRRCSPASTSRLLLVLVLLIVRVGLVRVARARARARAGARLAVGERRRELRGSRLVWGSRSRT